MVLLLFSMKSSYLKGLVISALFYYFTNYCNASTTHEEEETTFPKNSNEISGEQLNPLGNDKQSINANPQQGYFSKPRSSNYGVPYEGFNKTIVNKYKFNSHSQWKDNKQFGNGEEVQRPIDQMNRRYYHNQLRPYSYSQNRFRQRFRSKGYKKNYFRRHMNGNYNQNNFRPDLCHYGQDNALKCDVNIYFKPYGINQNFSQQPEQNSILNDLKSGMFLKKNIESTVSSIGSNTEMPSSQEKTHFDDALPEPALIAPKKIRRTRKPKVQTETEAQSVATKRSYRRKLTTYKPKVSQTEAQPEFLEFYDDLQPEQLPITPKTIARTRKPRSRSKASLDNIQRDPKQTAPKKSSRTRTESSETSITDTQSDPYESSEDSQPEPETIAPKRRYVTKQPRTQSKASAGEAQSDVYQPDEDEPSEPKTSVTKRIYRTRKPRVMSASDASITEINKKVQTMNSIHTLHSYILFGLIFVLVWSKLNNLSLFWMNTQKPKT